ncbi:MAG TPA: hypothetical protein VLF94_07330, partial [Chlamydiales bacterium]|nr:hypothetical protein [Chlamydiales bacterium]
NIKEFSSSGARFAKKWSGIQDFANGYTAYQKKDYHSLAKNLAIGLLKMGAIGASLYGAYHWTFSKPVLLSGAANQKPTPETKKTSPQPPTEQQVKSFAEKEKLQIKSMEERADNLYRKESRGFHYWPKDDQKFALDQMKSNTTASAAFMTRLLAQAIAGNDASLIKTIKRYCPAFGNTQTCLAALKSFVGDSTTPPTEQTLDEAAWINADCQNLPNEARQVSYCTQAYEAAKRQSIALKDVSAVNQILNQIALNPAISETDVPFIRQAVALYTKDLSEKESLATKTHVKGDDWKKEGAAFEELSHALNRGMVLAKVCLKVKNSYPCKKFVADLVQLLLKNDLLAAVLSLRDTASSGALTEEYLINAVDKLAREGNWGKAAKIITALPNSPATQNAIENTMELALSHLSATKQVLELYQEAKTWITPSGIKNEKQLMGIIEALLNNNIRSDREMALVLVTKLIQRTSSGQTGHSINASKTRELENLMWSRHLTNAIPGLSWSANSEIQLLYQDRPPLDSYYPEINETNWKEKLRAVGYTIK